MGQHWTINGRFLAQQMTGVQRYAREIVLGLDRCLARHPTISRELDVELLVPPDARAELALSVIRTRAVGRIGGHLWEQAVLPAKVRGGLLSLCNTGPILVRKHIVCIHDANTWNFPQSYSLAFRTLYRVLLPVLGRTAEQISSVSQYSAAELARHGICRSDKIFVVTNGHEHVAGWKAKHSLQTKRAAGPSTIVILGSSAPHKNAKLILGMADRLRKAGFSIAVVGMSDPRVFSLPASVQEAANVFWLGRLSDGELAALLSDSMCLAFPSFTEGFGLPPLEAMALGCPAVVSDRASLPEICGDAALYASPDDADAWYERFTELQRSRTLRLEMIDRGHARTSLYRWDASAALYLQAMLATDDARRHVQPAHTMTV